MTLREFTRRFRQERRVLIAVIAASALVLGGTSVVWAASAEAGTRTRLNTEIDGIVRTITTRVEVGRAVVSAHLASSVCVADVSSRLSPVAGSGTRFTPSALGQATTTVQRAADASPVPAYDPAPPPRPPGDAGLDELDSSLVVIRDALVTTEAEVAALASTARATEEACTSARRAEAAIVREITRRSDELIAANPKAAADLRSTLVVARDAVVAAESGGVEQWIAAAGALESSQASAVLAEQEAAAEAARRAELDVEESASSSGTLHFPPPNLEFPTITICEAFPDACADPTPAPEPPAY